MNKGGLSNIVAVVLIVLLVLAATILVWNIFYGVIDQEVETSGLTTYISAKKEYILVNEVGQSVDLIVERKPGQGDLIGFNVVLYDESGQAYSERFDIPLGELESTKVTVDYSTSNLGVLDKIEVHPILLSEEKKKEFLGSNVEEHEISDVNKITPLRVFVTSTTYNGSQVNRIVGADSKCQSLADTAGLVGTWKAWISNGTYNVSANFPHSATPYQLLDGKVIANDWTDLTDGTINFPIDIDENLVTVPASHVWTDTKSDGHQFCFVTSCHCGSWTIGSIISAGANGDSSSTSGSWAYAGSDGCGDQNRLYCFEQPS